MKFTQEQMAVLARYEDRLSSAFHAQWCRAMQTNDYETVYALWQTVSGESLEHNANCGSCVLQLMSRVGRAYFAQKEAAERVQVKQAKATAKRSVKINAKK